MSKNNNDLSIDESQKCGAEGCKRRSNQETRVTKKYNDIGYTSIIEYKSLKGGFMPWKECKIVNERMKFVLRLEGGERMTDLCKEFGISRKTGYKIWNRYNSGGLDGLFDESRKPLTNPNQTPESIERIIIKLKQSRPTWGATKLREYLIRKHKNL